MYDSEIRSNLLSGEHILWSGEPGKGIIFTGRDIFLIPFSLIWCGFAIFWTFMATGDGAPIFFTLWGLMFVTIGLFFVFGRFVLDIFLRKSTHYAVTDRRILISRRGLFPRFVSVRLDQLPDAKLSLASGGIGSITFGNSGSVFGNHNFGFWVPSLDPTPSLLGVSSANDVYGIIQRAADSIWTDRRQA